MNDKFLKSLIYTFLASILLIFFLIQPYNIFCRISKNCHPIILSSLIGHKSRKEKLTINFTAKISSELKNILEFYPEDVSKQIINGTNIITYYRAKNLTNKKITIRASYNISPLAADKYLDKVEDLCFQNQILEPYETIQMPINLRINSKIENDSEIKKIKTILFSYKAEIISN